MTGHRLPLAEQNLLLHPSGAVLWEEQATLFVSDLHLGKSTTFRRSGLPVPAGATTETFTRLTRCVEELQPHRLVVLGDLVHAKCSWDNELLEGLSRLVDVFPDGRFLLIEGNHDRGSRSRWARLSIDCRAAPYSMSPWTLLHDEVAERPGHSPNGAIYFAGHLHPAVKLVGSGESLRLRCFTLHRQCLTLPAFGAFTGCKLVEPHRDRRVFAVVDNEVMAIA